MYNIKIKSIKDCALFGVINKKDFEARPVEYKEQVLYKLFEEDSFLRLEESAFSRGERQAVAKFCKKFSLGIIDSDGKLVNPKIKNELDYLRNKAHNLAEENKTLKEKKDLLIKRENENFMKSEGKNPFFKFQE